MNQFANSFCKVDEFYITLHYKTFADITSIELVKMMFANEIKFFVKREDIFLILLI